MPGYTRYSFLERQRVAALYRSELPTIESLVARCSLLIQQAHQQFDVMVCPANLNDDPFELQRMSGDSKFAGKDLAKIYSFKQMCLAQDKLEDLVNEFIKAHQEVRHHIQLYLSLDESQRSLFDNVCPQSSNKFSFRLKEALINISNAERLKSELEEKLAEYMGDDASTDDNLTEQPCMPELSYKMATSAKKSHVGLSLLSSPKRLMQRLFR